MLLLDSNILIDVLRGEQPALDWLDQQQRPGISLISWIEVLVGCRQGEQNLISEWLEAFPRLPLDHEVAKETIAIRQAHGLRIPDAIILSTARCHGLTLATRNVRDFPLSLGGVIHPYALHP